MITRRTFRPLRLALATATAASLTAAVPLVVAQPAAAAPAKYGDDFNGDGYRDYAQTSEQGGAGFLVTYGTAAGPGTVSKKFTQASAGVPGTAGDAGGYSDLFGEDLAAADFDRDGYGDLAVGDRSEKVGGKVSAGAVTIMWGGKSGLGAKATRLASQPVTRYGFGADVETGDFDGDGRTDLAVADGSHTVHIFRGGFSQAGKTGKVTEHRRPVSASGMENAGLVAGKVTKDKATDLYVLATGYRNGKETQNAWFLRGGSTVKISGADVTVNSSTPGYGAPGVVADFDKDGYGDLAVGDSRYNGSAGSVVVVRGGASGPSTKYRLTQSTSGIVTAASKNDWFGGSLSAGDTDRDGYPDLAVGVWQEKVGSAEGAGGVHVLRGGAKGLSGTGSKWFTRATTGVPESPTEHEMFGVYLRLRDIDRDGDADLLVGDRRYGEEKTSLLFPGGPSGVSTGVKVIGLWPSFPQ
ncbi:FG-GAP and VCBS repeat-containing protein [Streptomyces sp. NPDC060194]|uniref:FG-GAP and VCBS repeat-containing protein n=1 Tax=Streptomyces sp. NPDC060194 TaxID=3347069 RepID=UPI003660E0EF